MIKTLFIAFTLFLAPIEKSYSCSELEVGIDLLTIASKKGPEWNNASSLHHVVRGEVIKREDGAMGLKGGMHTEDALNNLLKLTSETGSNFKIKEVASFTAKKAQGDEILSQRLPNGVRRLQLPCKAFASTRVCERASNAQRGDGRRNGIKTLFPEHYTPSDIADAGSAIFKPENLVAGTDNVYEGVYDGMKITVSVDKATGTINSTFPSWDQ